MLYCYEPPIWFFFRIRVTTYFIRALLQWHSARYFSLKQCMDNLFFQATLLAFAFQHLLSSACILQDFSRIQPDILLSRKQVFSCRPFLAIKYWFGDTLVRFLPDSAFYRIPDCQDCGLVSVRTSLVFALLASGIWIFPLILPHITARTFGIYPSTMIHYAFLEGNIPIRLAFFLSPRKILCL